ncbi:acetyl-CoA synthetase-like protein [Trametes versicolor FP-101664 SS1]|uniref:acetyl-CoA synthetase-like protein n=1 Tax=Trametes versicolor (strain FP-101664) TaxID=717944 RepID=UPI00046218A8|nr:acetyl-CoA synthetase-like protein [Trametes versicolor FP-101664 SS1]EIW58366.1 acetyl-CoA synthetase-like protein [Trametes versicolor FP-101664 SS1]
MGTEKRTFVWHIQALARGLLGLGVKKGDRVGVIMGNNSAYACLQWACASIGAILVTLNPAYRLPELLGTLNLVGVSHLFVSPRIRASAHVRMLCDAFPALASSSPGDIQEPALPHLRHLVVVDNVGVRDQFEREIEGAKPAVDFREVMLWREDTEERRRVEDIAAGLDVHDIINLQFTSGTTGLPKAASLTHYNLLNNALSIGRCMHFTPSDILCKDRNLAAWTHGACIVYASEVYDPSAIVDAITQERCTALHGVPTHLLGVLGEAQKRREEGKVVDTSCLRTGVAAGSPVPIELMKQLSQKLHLTELTVAYGMSTPVAFQTTPDDPVDKREETVGRIFPHAKAKVVDPEGRTVPVGTPGEVLVAGYLLQKGYYNDPEQTALAMQADEEGVVWMRSGDEGIMDEEGYLRIVGRIKDIIIRGGENLFPVQIENLLTAQPHIREAVVVSVPDPKYGEVVGAWISREPHMDPISKDAVRRIVAEGMNPQNSPAWVWFIGEDGVPEGFPKTASGKIQKHILRAWSKELAQKGVGRDKRPIFKFGVARDGVVGGRDKTIS